MTIETNTRPRDPSDFEQTVHQLDDLHDFILASSREMDPTGEQQRLSRTTGDMLSRVLARAFNPDFGARFELPIAREFDGAVRVLHDSTYALAGIDDRQTARPVDHSDDKDESLSGVVASIDLRPPFDNKDVVRLQVLMEIHSGLHNSEATSVSASRGRVEDGAMALCSLLSILLKENPGSYDEIMRDKKISEDLGYLLNVYQQTPEIKKGKL